jgi:hypothetical protein
VLLVIDEDEADEQCQSRPEPANLGVEGLPRSVEHNKSMREPDLQREVGISPLRSRKVRV